MGLGPLEWGIGIWVLFLPSESNVIKKSNISTCTLENMVYFF